MDSPYSNSAEINSIKTREMPSTQRDVERFVNLGKQDQYEGNYGKATERYLQALELLYQIRNCKVQGLESTLASLRALILAKLGDNFSYLGQHEIALKYYEQQLRTANSGASKLSKASAYQNIGFYYYFMNSHGTSIEFQQRSQEILQGAEDNLEGAEDNLEFKEIECSTHLCIGLNKHRLEDYVEANDHYQQSLNIARKFGLQAKEAEAIIRFNSLHGEKLGLESNDFDKTEIETIMGDLHYAIRIIDKNPYLKVLGLRELAKIHEATDFDISRKYYEDALETSLSYKIWFSDALENDIQRVLEKKRELTEQEYALDEQDWYHENFPKIPEIDREAIDSSGFKAEFAVITATSIELKAVVHLLEEDPDNSLLPCRVYTQHGQYYLGRFGQYATVVTQCRMGTRDERSAGFVTQKAIELWDPKAIIMVGIAFGKSPKDQKIADVLVATEIIDYEVNRVELDGIVDRGTRPPD